MRTRGGWGHSRARTDVQPAFHLPARRLCAGEVQRAQLQRLIDDDLASPLVVVLVVVLVASPSFTFLGLRSVACTMSSTLR